MKKLLLLLTLFFLSSCTDERETEYFNPQYQIKVNFETKKAWEAGRNLERTSDIESQICEKIIKGQPLPDNVKFSSLCSGGNDRGLNYAYVLISGDVNGYFLIVYDNHRIISFKVKNYNSGSCLLRSILEV
jgi:hypothetical protein